MCGHSGIGFPYEKKYTISIHIMGKHQFFGGLGQSEPEIVLPNFTNEKKHRFELVFIPTQLKCVVQPAFPNQNIQNPKISYELVGNTQDPGWEPTILIYKILGSQKKPKLFRLSTPVKPMTLARRSSGTNFGVGPAKNHRSRLVISHLEVKAF